MLFLSQCELQRKDSFNRVDDDDLLSFPPHLVLLNDLQCKTIGNHHHHHDHDARRKREPPSLDSEVSLLFFTLIFLSLCSSQNINHFLHFLMMLTNLPFVVTTEESNSKPEEGNLFFSSCSHKRHESHQRA